MLFLHIPSLLLLRSRLAHFPQKTTEAQSVEMTSLKPVRDGAGVCTQGLWHQSLYAQLNCGQHGLHTLSLEPRPLYSLLRRPPDSGPLCWDGSLHSLTHCVPISSLLSINSPYLCLASRGTFLKYSSAQKSSVVSLKKKKKRPKPLGESLSTSVPHLTCQSSPTFL